MLLAPNRRGHGNPHGAGGLGVVLADRFQARGVPSLSGGACMKTAGGRTVFGGFCLDLATDAARPLCRTCLDWRNFPSTFRLSV